MTSNQIAYVKAREEQRHNLAMEGETFRSNVARETENQRANDLNYSASIYASQASMYNAKLNYDANIYGAQLNAATSRYNAQLNAETQRYQAALNYQSQEENRIQTYVVENNRLGEQVRHNKATERAETSKAGSSRLSSVGSFLNNVAGAAKVGMMIAGLMA